MIEINKVMKLNLIVESIGFELGDPAMHNIVSENPCEYCLFGKGAMCVERKFCRWDSNKEIFIKKEVKELSNE